MLPVNGTTSPTGVGGYAPRALPKRAMTSRRAILSDSQVRWLLAFLFLNVPVLAFGMLWVVAFPHDWVVLAQVPARLSDGTLYDHTPLYDYVWSPIMAWVLALVIIPAGYWALFAARVATLPFLGRGLALLTVLSLPFWIDAINGNYFTFIVVAGVLALRGSRVGGLAFLALACLMPRPIQVPMAAYLLWHRPDLRIPFAAMVAVSVAVAVASGYAPDWLGALSSFGGESRDHMGPTRFFGSAWFLVGVPLAIWLTVKGRVGWAGLALSPYVLPQYLLAILWESEPSARSDQLPSRSTGSTQDRLVEPRPEALGEPIAATGAPG